MFPKRLRILVLSALALMSTCGPALGAGRSYDFERSAAGWDTDEVERPALRLSEERASSGKRSLMLDEGVLAVRRFRCTRPQNWTRATSLSFDVYLPADAPGTVQTAAYVAGSEHRWFQAMGETFLTAGRWTHVRIELAAEPTRWRPVEHQRPWDVAARADVAEFGIKVFGYGVEYRGPIWLDNVRIEQPRRAKTPVKLYGLRENAQRVGRYGLFELSFSLSRAFDNPFDPREVDIVAHFTAPSGKESRVRAFWFQDYNRALVGVEETLTPVGPPEWKLRFTPSEVGEYRYRLEVRAAGEGLSRHVGHAYDAWSRSAARRWARLARAVWRPTTLQASERFDAFAWIDALERLVPARLVVVRTAERPFTCVPSAHPGFVRVAKNDPRFFEFDNGEFLWPRGLNVCAAFDVRNAERLGVMVNRWEGSYALGRFIRNMGRSRMNFARLWMACWSLAIEWGHKYQPQFHGPGRYNLENAWRLDLLLEEARRSGTLLQPTLDTFGHFRGSARKGGRDRHMDWSYNAYNADNGGFVHESWRFFTDPDCFDFYRRRLEYIVARWSYSPEVFGWELCNEIDLITRYDSPTIVEWHRRVCDALHAMDPFDHPVTTNFASYLRDYDVWRLPELDYLTSNRYAQQLPYFFAWLSQDRRMLLDQPMGVRRPHLLLEAGSDFRGGDRRITEDYFHISLWSAWMFPLAGAGVNWWWVFIDQEDLYTHAEAFERYIRDEDKRGVEWEYKEVSELPGRPGGEKAARLWKDFKPKPPTVVFADPEKAKAGHLDLQYLRGPQRMYAWIFDQAALGIVTAEGPVKRVEGVSVAFKDVAPAVYQVEVWDTYAGRTVAEEERPVKGGDLVVGLPPFQKDIALKVNYARDLDPEYLDQE